MHLDIASLDSATVQVGNATRQADADLVTVDPGLTYVRDSDNELALTARYDPWLRPVGPLEPTQRFEIQLPREFPAGPSWNVEEIHRFDIAVNTDDRVKAVVVELELSFVKDRGWSAVNRPRPAFGIEAECRPTARRRR